MATQQAAASIQRLSTTSLDVLQQQIASGEAGEDLRAVFGEAGAAELEQMAQSGDELVLGPGERPVVVVLAGITGSTLMNVKGDVGLIWVNPLALAAGKLHLLQLQPDGTSDMPGTQIIPAGLLPTHYLLIQMHLKTFGGCDVYSFPFDWRRTPLEAAEHLRQFVSGLRQQTGRKVHLVGHSMGGLVARTYCTHHADEASENVAQVIQLGTPNYGSFSALQSLLSNDGMVALMQKINSANQPLAFTRSCPGLYAMFPAPHDAYPADAPFPYPFDVDFDLFDESRYGVDSLSRSLVRNSYTFYVAPDSNAELPVPATIIAGYGVPTCISMTINRDGGTPVFQFSTTGDGDGTVPLASATALPGAKRLYGRGLKHGELPLYGAVRNAVADLVNGRTPTTLATEPYTQVLGEEPELTLSVPDTPPPSQLDEATIEAVAKRIRNGTATPADLRIITFL